MVKRAKCPVCAKVTQHREVQIDSSSGTSHTTEVEIQSPDDRCAYYAVPPYVCERCGILWLDIRLAVMAERERNERVKKQRERARSVKE